MSDPVLERPRRALGPSPVPPKLGVLLGRGRRQLAETLRAYPAPSRVLTVERDPAPPVDLEHAFPEATVWEGALAPRPEWAGWPDLLWLGFALSARADAGAAVTAAWRALPAGARVACVDVDDVGRADVARHLASIGLGRSRDGLAALRRAFVPLEVTFHADPDGAWRTFTFVGTKPSAVGR